MPELMTFKKKAMYAFSLKTEFEKNAELVRDENVSIQGKIKFFVSPIVAPQGYMAFTNKRIFFIRRFIFRPDILYSIELKDIVNLNLKWTTLFQSLFAFQKFPYIELEYSAGEKICFFAYSWRPTRPGPNLYAKVGTTQDLFKKISSLIKNS